MNEEILIGIIGAFCDYMVDDGRCDVLCPCPYAETKDEHDECEVWRTITSIREGRNL